VVSLLRPGGGLFAPISGGHFDRFFHIIRNHKITLIDKSIREKASELCAIRNFLYKWVCDELEDNNILN
jgi:hypothetical protein